MKETQFEELFQRAHSLYESGDYKAAFKEYYVLAEQGYSNCQMFVGWMYFTGTGTDKNYSEARVWLLKAASKGDAEAMFYLGKLAILNKNYDEATHWFEQSGAKEYPPAIYKLGCLYERNKNFQKDKTKSFELFKKASDLGHVFAQKEYALKLMKGYRGILGFFEGIFIYIKIFFRTIKLASSDPHDERLRT